MEAMRRFSRRTFVAWVGGAGAGFYLFGRLHTRDACTRRARRNTGQLARSAVGSKVPDIAAHPAGDAEGRHDRPAGSGGRLLRDLDEAVRAADPALGLPATTVWGYGAVGVGKPGRP